MFSFYHKIKERINLSICRFLSKVEYEFSEDTNVTVVFVSKDGSRYVSRISGARAAFDPEGKLVVVIQFQDVIQGFINDRVSNRRM